MVGCSTRRSLAPADAEALTPVLFLFLRTVRFGLQLAVGDTQNKAWVEEAKSSFGYKMMLKMGWNEKTGLGKDGDGSVAHIRIKKRADNVGTSY